MQEGSNAFDDSTVTPFRDTIVLRGMMNSKFLFCALRL